MKKDTNKKNLYYTKNRFRICKNLLYNYVPKSIRTIHSLIPDKIEEYYVKFPYELSGFPVIKKTLCRFRISPDSITYQECIDAGSDAYLYSIHRCALKNYQHVNAYIKKVIPIFINCALNICNEAKQIRHETGLSVINLDSHLPNGSI